MTTSETGLNRIFRGISVGHYRWTYALTGIAMPGDLEGHEDPARHNAGDTRTSRFTSWTHSRAIAEDYAGAGGLLLEWTTGSPPDGADWRFEWSPDIFYEQEVLICGTLIGAWVTQL